MAGPPDAADERAAIDARLAAMSHRASTTSGRVGEAMGYALTGGGKRLRGMLVLAAYRAAGGRGDATGLAAAVEVVHAYSLVHDDLPCMDDDSFRRGRPTVHVAFSVEVAIAAGLAMVPLAVRCVIEAGEALELGQDAVSEIVRTLMVASGAGGMIGGQLLDLEAEGRSLGIDDLERIHRGKTGALIAAATRVGGIAAGASPRQLDALVDYGHSMGLAFQIVDDVLDVTATTRELGKTAGKDVALAKATYPSALGVDGAVERATRLVEEGCRNLESAGLLTEELAGLARFTLARRS